MRVTINTDASYNHRVKRGSYAYWIVSNSGKICKTGVFKHKIKDNTQAELRAILLALKALTQKSDWEDITDVIINTDNMFCVKNLNGFFKDRNFPLRRKDLLIYFNHFRGLVKKLPDITLEVRHVKAHESTGTKRQYVNDWCDQNAKQTLRKYLSSKTHE